MKITALTILFACALLGASCSDSTTETAAAPAKESVTPAPPPTPTEEEQLAAIRNSAEANRAAEQRKKKQNAEARNDAALTADGAVVAPLPLDASVSRPSPTGTP